MSAAPANVRPTPTSTDRSATAKRAETRVAILTSAMATIDELGVAGASASEIARRAAFRGVSSSSTSAIG